MLIINKKNKIIKNNKYYIKNNNFNKNYLI